MRVSVCMTTYNGAPHVEVQIRSILNELSALDELIVVDDCSDDLTLPIVTSISDHRLRVLINNRNLGVVKSFSRALSESSGEIIFLSDQDDVWQKGKVKRVLDAFGDPRAQVVTHAATWVDQSLTEIPNLIEQGSRTFFGLLFKNCAIGATMALRRSFYENIKFQITLAPMHDWFIALVAAYNRSLFYVPENLILYRRHPGTATQPNGRIQISFRAIRFRVQLLWAFANWFFRNGSQL